MRGWAAYPWRSCGASAAASGTATPGSCATRTASRLETYCWWTRRGAPTRATRSSAARASLSRSRPAGSRERSEAHRAPRAAPRGPRMQLPSHPPPFPGPQATVSSGISTGGGVAGTYGYSSSHSCWLSIVMALLASASSLAGRGKATRMSLGAPSGPAARMSKPSVSTETMAALTTAAASPNSPEALANMSRSGPMLSLKCAAMSALLAASASALAARYSCALTSSAPRSEPMPPT
mmetsp:Transcript_18674/g.63607  ORF Transcript_18674/g.63607 Transcript_18674/m.63607 type:complete len:237 (+) Transcript_18674:283-993(+)